MNTTEKIIAYFEEHEDIFNDCIIELDSYSGYLGDDRCYPMEYMDELYPAQDATELLRRAFYGYDAESYTTDSEGTKHYEQFNPNRDYFYFNGYGNLVSCDYPDYSGFLDRHLIEDMSRNRSYIDTIANDDELTVLFDELEAE